MEKKRCSCLASAYKCGQMNHNGKMIADLFSQCFLLVLLVVVALDLKS